MSQNEAHTAAIPLFLDFFNNVLGDSVEQDEFEDDIVITRDDFARAPAGWTDPGHSETDRLETGETVYSYYKAQAVKGQTRRDVHAIQMGEFFAVVMR